MRAAAVAVVLAAPGLAIADAPARRPLSPVRPSPPDSRAAAMSAESNLEWPRSGFRASAAIGPAMQIGVGIDDSSGKGGGISLRVGTASGPRLAWLLELASTGYAAENVDLEAKLNSSSLLTLGAQVHVTEAVWVRFGAGLATFVQRSETGQPEFAGVGSTFGAGYDVVRRGDLALSLELAALGAFYDGDSLVTSSVLALGVTYY